LEYDEESRKRKVKKHIMAPEVLETFISIPEKARLNFP
jgi:hypothetical protein